MKKLLLALLISLLPSIVWAQSQRNPCYNTGTTNCIGVGTNTPLPVIGTGGFGPYSYTPLSPMQTNLSIASSTALTIPSGSTYAVICARSQNVNYTTDGTTTPTASVGMQLLQNQCVSLSGSTVLSNFRAIQQAATATLDINYFK